jgi:tetratricopeptide (TPR) repeat protein
MLVRTMLILALASLIYVCPLQAGSNLDKGTQYLKNEEYEKAKEFFVEKVRGNKRDGAANHYLGRTYLLLGDHDKAIDYCKRAVEIDDVIADYHYWLGQALGMKAQNSNVITQALLAPKILREFERTVEIDSTHVGGHVGAANFYLQAPSFMGGDIGKAYKEAEILLKLDERQGRLILIGIYERENKLDLAEEAYEDYDRSFNDSTDNDGFYSSYGYFLVKRKKYNKAIEMFQKQVRVATDRAYPYDSLGDGYRAAGRFEEALSLYHKAVEIDPHFKPSLKKIEELKKQLGKNES